MNVKALSITTDYLSDTGDIAHILNEITKAGFTHVHWCQDWHTRHLYAVEEIHGIKRALKERDLQLLDTHGASTEKYHWCSWNNARRREGVKLLENRIKMTSELGGDAVVMHTFRWMPGKERQNRKSLEMLQRSIDEVMPLLQTTSMKLALENMADDPPDLFDRIFSLYPADRIGMCYDSGHGNMRGATGLSLLERFRERIVCVHLHDNDGNGDQHNLPLTGTVDWDGMTALLAGSSYTKCINLEVTKKGSGIEDESGFLNQAFSMAVRIQAAVDERRIQ